MAEKNRNIGPENQLKAARLKKEIKRHNNEYGSTMQDIADKMQLSKSAVSQYTNNHIALNTEAILRFSKALGIEGEKIDPQIKQLTSFKGLVRQTVPVIGTMTNRMPKTNLAELAIKNPKPNLAAYESDRIFRTDGKSSGYIIVDLAKKPSAEDNIVYRLRDKLLVYLGKFESYCPEEKFIVTTPENEKLTLNANRVSYIAVVHEYLSDS